MDIADFFLFADRFGEPARAKLVTMAREMIGLPGGVQLQQNAPNPFNSGTVISWVLPGSGPARLEVFSLTGQRLAVLHEGPGEAGLQRLRWAFEWELAKDEIHRWRKRTAMKFDEKTPRTAVGSG